MTYSIRTLITALLLVIFVSSCSRRGEILESIPTDVAMVATVNFDKFSNAAGVTLKDDGSIDMSTRARMALQKYVEDFELLGFVKSGGYADIENVVVVVDKDQSRYVIVELSDTKEFIDITRVDWKDGSNGYKIARDESATYLIKDNLLWFVYLSRDAIESVEGLKKRAEEMSIAQLDGINAALKRDNIANIALTSGFYTFTTSGKSNTEILAKDLEWSVASLQEGADQSLVIDFEMMQSTGRTIEPKGLQNINPAVLSYIPENFNIAMTAGLTGEFDWEPLRQLVMLAGNFQTAAFMSVINPYLESIDGTVIMAAAPSSPDALGEIDPSDWDFIFMAHIPQSKINSLMDMITNMMTTAGIKPTMTPSGLMAIPQYGKTLYIGNVDGYLGVATMDFDNTRNNSLAPTFVNKDVAATISLNPMSDYIEGAPKVTGIIISASMDNGRGTVKLQATGTKETFIVYLLGLFND